MIITITQLFQLLFLFTTVAAIGSFTSLNNMTTVTFWWPVNILMLVLTIKLKRFYFNKNDNLSLIWPVQLFLVWNIIGITRGFYVAENYWEFKNLVGVALAMLLPLTIYVFTNKYFVQQLIRFWLRYALLALFVFVPFITISEFYGRYLTPIMFLLLLLPILSLRWKLIVIIFTAIVFFAGFDARSNIIRFSGATFLGLLFYFRWFIKSWMFKVAHSLLILLPIVLLVLGVTGTFNIFKMDEFIKGDYLVESVQNGITKQSSLLSDSRTFIYSEAINSAINNNYILLGRTPARGYDSESFGGHQFDKLGTGKMERFSSEVSIVNIFTRTGLIGVILYFLVFYWASFLAIYRSNSFFMKIIGLFVAFRWDLAFIGDIARFNMNYLFLLLIIGICYSYDFRRMNNEEFKDWARGITEKRFQLNTIVEKRNS